MNTSEELAGITITTLKDFADKVLDVLQELLKALIARATKDIDKAKPGQNKINKLLSGGNKLNAPVKIDEQDINIFYKLAKDHHVPVAVIKSGEENRAFFRESDVGMVSHFMKEILVQKMEVDKDKQKELVLNDRLEATKFKHRADKARIPCSIINSEDGTIKVCFYDKDIDKVKAIVEDLKVAQSVQSKRTFTLDKAKDSVSSLLTNSDIIRIYDADLNSNIKLKLPITKNAFVKKVKAAFGYSEQEALDMAARVEVGNFSEGYIASKGPSKYKWQWKPEYKDLFKQVLKYEKDISLNSEKDDLKQFSFSTLTLADGKDTQVLTVTDNNSDKSFTTEPVDKSTFTNGVTDNLGVAELIAGELVNKSAKLGFITDTKELSLSVATADNTTDEATFEACEINKSASNSTATFSFNGKTYNADLSNKDTTIQGLQSTFSLSAKQADLLFIKAEKQGVAEAVKSAVAKSNTYVKNAQPINKAINKTNDKGSI